MYKHNNGNIYTKIRVKDIHPIFIYSICTYTRTHTQILWVVGEKDTNPCQSTLGTVARIQASSLHMWGQLFDESGTAPSRQAPGQSQRHFSCPINDHLSLV